MSLFHLMSVSASGMGAQRKRAELLVENLANAETTRTAEGGPYRRKDVIFESREQASPFSAVFQTAVDGQVQGVSVTDILTDTREPERRYVPGHPDADENGYVSFPRLNPAEEMVDLMSATRGYQANVAAMQAVKDMILRSIDLMK
ncbi:MAG: flagellar basal body rod protein FlgC [Bryobacteraceae bacterium]|nr:flagellar basal body rod protein FlgC [Bryobacteraceae bacterium]